MTFYNRLCEVLWNNVYILICPPVKPFRYVRQEISNAWEWMTEKHPQDDWDRFIGALSIMYFNCSQENEVSCLAALNEANMRYIYLFDRIRKMNHYLF